MSAKVIPLHPQQKREIPWIEMMRRQPKLLLAVVELLLTEGRPEPGSPRAEAIRILSTQALDLDRGMAGGH